MLPRLCTLFLPLNSCHNKNFHVYIFVLKMLFKLKKKTSLIIKSETKIQIFLTLTRWDGTEILAVFVHHSRQLASFTTTILRAAVHCGAATNKQLVTVSYLRILGKVQAFLAYIRLRTVNLECSKYAMWCFSRVDTHFCDKLVKLTRQALMMIASF